jgi:hypothetical protein
MVRIESDHCIANLTSYLQYIFFSEWNENPILITIETTDYPIENITFPTVTVCREENEPNCFEFVTKIFDYFPFPCFDDG